MDLLNLEDSLLFDFQDEWFGRLTIGIRHLQFERVFTAKDCQGTHELRNIEGQTCLIANLITSGEP